MLRVFYSFMELKIKQTKNKQKGFTLIELLVVISIIGILSSFAVVSLNSARIKARDALRKGDMSQLRTAMVLYYDDNFSYPICGSAAWDPLAADYGAVAGDAVGEGCECYNNVLVPALQSGTMPVMPDPPMDPMNPTNSGCAADPQHYRYISSPNGQEYAVIYNLEDGGQRVLKGW